MDEVISTTLGASTGEAQENVAIAIAQQVVDFLISGKLNAVNLPMVSPDIALSNPFAGWKVGSLVILNMPSMRC
jgi:D-3-phosphoglycerate dehydrogenase